MTREHETTGGGNGIDKGIEGLENGRNCWGMMMVRFVVVLALLAGFGCQGEKAAEKAGAETTAEQAEARKEIPVAKIPKREEEKEKVPCDGMFQLLRKCNKGSRAFRDPRFRSNFISGCEEERKRPTEYAKLFSECVVSTTCDGLKKCSENLRQKAIELGPDHFDYLLKNTERDAALKFCDDHRQLLSRNIELERRCKPLLGILDEQRKEHEHDGSCNH